MERQRSAGSERQRPSDRQKSSERRKSFEQQKTVRFSPGAAEEPPQQPRHATLKVIAAGQSTTSTHWLQDTLCFYGMKTLHDHTICDPKSGHKGGKQQLDAQANLIESKHQMKDLQDFKTADALRGKLDHFVKYVQDERLSAIADFPVFYFFDELRAAFPCAAVLLSTRNSSSWATARRFKNNLMCREAVSGSPMEAASAQMSPKLPHPFALLPCLERQLLRGGDASLAFVHMSELQANATGLAKLSEAFEAYNMHVRQSTDASKTPFAEIDVANPGTKEGDDRVKNAALVKIAEILDPKVHDLVSQGGLNISQLSIVSDVRPFAAEAVAALISTPSQDNASSPVAGRAAALADTSWFAAEDAAVKANATAERDAAAASTSFAAQPEPSTSAVSAVRETAAPLQQQQQNGAANQTAAAVNHTEAAVAAAADAEAAKASAAAAKADAAVQEELVAQLRSGKALHAAERAAGEALAERAEAAVAAAERIAQKALADKAKADRSGAEAKDEAEAAAEQANAAAEVAAAERALAELKVAVGKATQDQQSDAAMAEQKAVQEKVLADKAQAAAQASAAEAAAKAELQHVASDKVAEELAAKAESAAAAARAVQEEKVAVQNAAEQKLGAIMSGIDATEQKLVGHKAEKEAAEKAVREVMAAAPDHTLKVIAAGQSTTSTTWMQDTLCAFGLKTWHDHMICVPEGGKRTDTADGHVPYRDNGEPMKRFGAFAKKMAAHHRMEDLADVSSPDQLSGVLARFKEFIVAERLTAVADFPVFYFFDELHAAFPRAAILLSVRNSTEWATARRMKNNLLCREAVSDERPPLAEKLEPALPHPFALLPCLTRHLILGGKPDQAFVQASDLQNNASGLVKLAAAFDAYNQHVRDVALRAKTAFAEVDVVNGLETDGLVKVAEILTGAAEELLTAAEERAPVPVRVVDGVVSAAAEDAMTNQTLPVAVICADVGNARHAAEFVEYHTSLGFARIYAYESGLTEESRAVLKSFAPGTVTILEAEPSGGGVSQCIQRISADYGIEGPERARQHVWIFTIDADEFVSPFAVAPSVPQVLAHYEAQGALHLHLEKVWFGGGWNRNVEECRAGPLLARFVRYGTQEQSKDGPDMHLAGARSAGAKIGKPAFSTRALPPLQALQALQAVAEGSPQQITMHMDAALLQNVTNADVEGPHGLVLHHFKPQSFEEYRAAVEFKQSRQRLRQRRDTSKGREAEPKEADQPWVNKTWSWIHNHTNGATHASMLLRVPAICRSFPRFAASLRECGLQDLCNDCQQLQVRHGCAREPEKPTQSAAASAAAAAVALHRVPTVDVMGSGAALVVGALNAAGLSAQSVDVSQLTKVAAEGVRVQTDLEDSEAVCAALCERTLVIDPKLVADEATIVSMIKAWTGSSHWPHPFA